MRLKEDSGSWGASSIQRRDYRHDFGTPEIPKGHPKRKQRVNKPRTRHKHVWVEEPKYTGYWFERDLPPAPHWSTSYHCSVVGCTKRKHVPNPRCGYEMHKWRKNNGMTYYVIEKGR